MDVFELTGSYSATPASGSDPEETADVIKALAESLLLKGKLVARYALASDSVQTVSLGGLTNVHVLILKTSGKVRTRLTSTDGSSQAIPVDSFLALVTESVAITAIDLTRVTGVDTVVQVFLGEKF